MKARNIKSLFWDKRLEHGYSKEASYFYLYLLTCKHIGLTPYFLLVEQYALIETGLTVKEIAKAKAELTAKDQVYFYKSWVFIKNADEHNSYHTSPKTRIAYERELANIPSDVMVYFSQVNGVENVVDNDRVSIGYGMGMDTHISISNKHNNKYLEGGVGETLPEPAPITKAERAKNELAEAADKVIATYNEVFGKKLKSGASLIPNLEYWLHTYDLDEILEAVRKSKAHHFWGDKINPEILLRKKNPQGENVDRIGEMLNYQVKKQFTNENKSKYDNI